MQFARVRSSRESKIESLVSTQVKECLGKGDDVRPFLLHLTVSKLESYDTI